jgi:multiple sugar transport system permease protein
MARGMRSQKTLNAITSYASLAFFTVLSLGPFYWMLVTSLKTRRELYRIVSLWPQQVYWGHWKEVFTTVGVTAWMVNSLEVAMTTTVLSVLIGIPAAYAISRLRFPGRKALGLSLILVYLVPSYVLFIPYFAILVRLGLTNSLLGLALTHLSFTVPFCTWVLMGYFKTVPRDLEDAAFVDGCGRLGALVRILVPLSTPAIVVTAMFSFTLSWNEFLYAIVYITDRHLLTISGGLVRMMTEDEFPWGQLMSASILTSVVPVMLYFVSQRWVVRGLVAGGVKG